MPRFQFWSAPDLQPAKANMYQLLGWQPAVEKVPSDRVLPLHLFEGSRLVQGNNTAVSIVFDEVLDPAKLRQSLEALAKRDGWQRLGGRLRKNVVSGAVEWHIPAEFTEQRAAVDYAHVDHGVPATAHPAASQLPQPSERPAIVGDPDDLAELAWGPGRNSSSSSSSSSPAGAGGIINDYLTSDRPVLGLRVHSFTDKTIAVLQWPHAAFDAVGIRHVVEAWSAVLWGREDQIPTPCSADADPFDAIAKGTRPVTEPHVLADRRVGLGGMLQWGLGYGVDTLLRDKENRMICVPESYWRPQMERALGELRAEAIEKGEDLDKVFLTESDVLTAWLLRCVVGPMDMDPRRLVAGSISMSLRKAFEGDLLPPSAEQRPYVGSAFGWANVLVTAGDITTKPLSWLAGQVRRAISEQGTREQHEAYYSMVKNSGAGLPVVVFGDGDTAQVDVSNWSKAGLFDLDFAPARKILKEGSPPCRPCYVQENHGPVKATDGFVVLGKDQKGNYWTSAYKLKGDWDKFQEQLDYDFEVGA